MFNKFAVQRGPVVATAALVGLLVLVVALFSKSTPTLASPASVNSAAPTDSFVCTPIEVAVFANRVHVHCSSASPGGFDYFAVSTADSASASRYMSAFTTAFVMGKQLTILFDPADLSGQAIYCLNTNCRLATGALVMGP